MLPFPQNSKIAVVAIEGLQSDNSTLHHHWCTLQTIDKAAEWAYNMGERGCDIYFATGGYESGLVNYKTSGLPALLSPRGGRVQGNCVEQRSLFLDIDAKAFPNKTVGECMTALQTFLVTTGFAAPTTVVNSGGGVHAYWIADESIPLPLWQAMADTLAGMARFYALPCDPQCTVDRSRILRMPGFINTKYGTEVEVIFTSGEPFTIEELAQELTPHFELRGHRPATATPETAAIAGIFDHIDFSGLNNSGLKGNDYGVTTSSWAKLRDASDRGDGCQVIQWVRRNQAQVGYDLWTGVLSIANHTDDVAQAVVDTCSEYPGYNFQTCLQKASTFDGPRRCERLREAAEISGCANACQGCPFSGKIGSPVVLGQPSFHLKGEVEVVEQRVTVETPQADGTVHTAVQITTVEKRPLPFPYCRVPGKPGVFVKELTEDENGKKVWEVSEHPLMREDISVVLVKSGHDGVTAYYEYVHPMQGMQKFSIPMHGLVSPQSTTWPAILADHHVNMGRAAVDPLWRARVSKFLQDIANDYTQNFKAAETVEQFGPIADKDDTFVYGSLCYRAGAAPVRVVLAEGTAAPWAEKMAEPAATEEEVQTVMQKIERWNAGLAETIGDSLTCSPDQFVLMSGFGCSLAPFVAPARQRGGMIVPNSPEAGSGKTSMVARAIQMYVSGDEGFLVPDTTKMAFLERYVAMAGALPVCMDEVMKGRDDRNNAMLHELALSSTNRKPRERLSGEQVNVSWQSWFYGTMNPDPHEAISAVSSSANGAVARVLNIKVSAGRFGAGPELLRRQQAENRFNDWCVRNANVVGQRWIEHFMQNLPNLRERYLHWSGRLVKDCPSAFADSSMRFVTTIVATTMTAAEEAHRAGLHPFNVEQVYAYAVTLLSDSSEKASDAVVQDTELLPMLINSSLDVTLVVSADGMSIADKVPTKEIGVRVERGTGEFSDVFITTGYAKTWCATRGISYAKLRSALQEVGADSTTKRMGAGTVIPSGPLRAFHFKHATKHLTTPEGAGRASVK